MGGGNYASMGMGTMGGIVGGIGDIIQAQNYKQPKLLDPVGPEKRLRQLAQSQLLGGGQQLLGATALYNQMAPLLMSQLPGMSYHAGDGTDGGDAGGGTGGGIGQNVLGSYGAQLQDLQHAQLLQQQLLDLKKQRSGAKGKANKQQYKQQIKDLKREIKSQPTVAQQERRAYTVGAQPGAYDIRQGPPSGGPPPSVGSSLESINDLLGGYGGGGDQHVGPSFLDRYNAGLGDQGMQRSLSDRMDPRFSLDLNNPSPSSVYRDPFMYNSVGARSL